MTASDHLPVVADYRLPSILRGDYDGSGLVEQADLDLVLFNWGQATRPFLTAGCTICLVAALTNTSLTKCCCVGAVWHQDLSRRPPRSCPSCRR
jgi:hypothetical protein